MIFSLWEILEKLCKINVLKMWHFVAFCSILWHFVTFCSIRGHFWDGVSRPLVAVFHENEGFRFFLYFVLHEFTEIYRHLNDYDKFLNVIIGNLSSLLRFRQNIWTKIFWLNNKNIFVKILGWYLVVGKYWKNYVK